MAAGPAAMNKLNALKLALATALLAGATFMFVRFFQHDSGVAEKTFFYDLSEKKLFAASRELLPPIRGLKGKEEDAVRAVVISSGNPKEKANQKIAYLEKYAPELKQHLAKVRAGQVEPLPRGARDSFRFVKPVNDSDLLPPSSPEANKILPECNIPGPTGQF